MIDRKEQVFGQYYRHIPKGKKQQFLRMIAKTMGKSCFYWRRRFSEWSKGTIRGKRMDDKTKQKLAIAITQHLQLQNIRR